MKRIRIAPNQKLCKGIVPGFVFATSPFVFTPVGFAAESEKLNERIYEESLQVSSLEEFQADPQIPVNYAVAGNPDDAQARLFAAYLVNIHVAYMTGSKTKYPRVVWHALHGGFANPVAHLEDPPTMIVLTNLSPVATGVKLDKTRDICEAWPSVPKVFVISGEDPISFMATRLYLPCHGLAYFCDSLMKKRVEVL